MEADRLLSWIENRGLSKYVKRSVPRFKNILKDNLGAKKEKLLIISDLGTEDRRIPAIFAASYYSAAKELGIKSTIAMQRPVYHTETAGDEVIEALLDHGENNLIAIALSGKLGSMREIGRSFRKHVSQRKHRFVSTPSLAGFSTEGYKYLLKAIDVDYTRMARKGEKIKEVIDSGQEVHVRTRKGTDLFYDVKGRTAINNTGLYREDSQGGNIPAGEVYVACNNEKVHGTIVIDGSLKTRQRCILLKHPVKLTVEKGEIVDIKGNGLADELRRTFEWAEEFAKHPENIRRIGELGIGTNPNAKVVGPTIINEKSLGTAHIAIGSNHWFGGDLRSIIHLDQVFYDPMIEVDGKVLNGNFLA